MFDSIFTKNSIGNISSTNKKKYPEEYTLLKTVVKCIPEDSTLSRYEWHVINNIYDALPPCHICGAPTKWQKQTQSYSKYCSQKCQGSDQAVKDARKITMNAKYGVEFPSHDKTIREKQKQTCIDRYGYASPLSSPIFQEQIKQTCIDRYGVETPARNNLIYEKIQSTTFNKYGTISFNQSKIEQSSLDILKNKDELFKLHITDKMSLTEIGAMLGVTKTTVSRHMKDHNIDVVLYGMSIGQKELHEFIENIANSRLNDRRVIWPSEIDIYIPDKLIGVEYNGLYWHSEGSGKKKQYHINKLNICNSKNIKLIQIFSSEWINKQDIVKSRINHILGNSNKIYARKCSIVQLTSSESRTFLNDNHIQGSIKAATIHLGLKYDDQIVAVMTIGKPRFSDKYDYELLRFCTLLNTNVVGGASKIFKYFLKTYSPKNIISYADRRWSEGDLYKILGFDFSHNSGPNFYYFKQNDSTEKLFSRIAFQKHKLKDKLEDFDPKLSAWQNMQNHGYDRVWDCGNSVWVWSATN